MEGRMCCGGADGLYLCLSCESLTTEIEKLAGWRVEDGQPPSPAIREQG